MAARGQRTGRPHLWYEPVVVRDSGPDVQALVSDGERGVFDLLPGGIVQVSSDGKILYANTEAKRVLGLSYDALTSRYVEDWTSETLREDGSLCPPSEYPVSQALQTGTAAGPTVVGVRRPEGSVAWAVFRAFPIRDATGGQTGALVSFVDISDRKRAETERERLMGEILHAQRLETVGQLAGGIAHDFNNLLQVILGNLELVPEGMRGSEGVQEIRQAALAAADLTRQLLAFGRRQPIQPTAFDVNGVVEATTRMLRRTMGADFEIEVRPEAPEAGVLADQGQIEQVLVNLCVNARDAMPEGGIIDVHTESRHVEGAEATTLGLTIGDYVLIHVRDHGMGIPRENLDRVFEPFFTTKPVGAGTGLGLAVVHGIVRKHGGAIRVQSSDVVGTAFSVYLPRHDGTPPPVEEPETLEPASGTETLLLVEDEAMIRKLNRRVLERAGYRVLEASNGVEALSVYRDHADDIDLMILDVVMPRMGGYEFYDRIASTRGARPVLYTSGNARRGGASGERTPMLAKPYKEAQLLEMVRAALDGAHRAAR
jgi:PAS domain S-box-containing protein